MHKDIAYILIFLISSGCFSQKIKTINEFRKDQDSLIKTRSTEFDKLGNLIKDVEFGGYDAISDTFRNRNRVVNYQNGRRVAENNCEDFVAKDTCVTRSFSIYEYNFKTKVEKETKFEPDSLIRYIREIKTENNIRISKTYSWEFNPVKKPDYENALIFTDTTYFDKKKRLIKRINYNSRIKEPFIEKYVYSKNKYTYQTIGTARDTILTLNYNKLQTIVDRKNVDYMFKPEDNYQYQIEYY